MMIKVEDTIREMIEYFEECAGNADRNSKAEKRFARYVLVLNLMLKDREDEHD